MDFKLTNNIDIDLNEKSTGLTNSIIISLLLDDGQHWGTTIKSRLYELNSIRIDGNFQTEFESILEELTNKKKEELQLDDISYNVEKIDNRSYKYKIIIKKNNYEEKIEEYFIL